METYVHNNREVFFVYLYDKCINEFKKEPDGMLFL